MTKQPQYSVRGTVNADPKSEARFYQIDGQSGYPYASPGRGKITTDLLQAVGWLKECSPTSSYSKMCNARVVRIDYVPINIDNVLAEQASAEELVAGMSDIEKAAVRRLLK